MSACSFSSAYVRFGPGIETVLFCCYIPEFSCQTSSVSVAWFLQLLPPQESRNRKEEELLCGWSDLQKQVICHYFGNTCDASSETSKEMMSQFCTLSCLTPVIQTVSNGRLYLLLLRQSTCVGFVWICCIIWCILLVSGMPSVPGGVPCRQTWYLNIYNKILKVKADASSSLTPRDPMKRVIQRVW